MLGQSHRFSTFWGMLRLIEKEGKKHKVGENGKNQNQLSVLVILN